MCRRDQHLVRASAAASRRVTRYCVNALYSASLGRSSPSGGICLASILRSTLSHMTLLAAMSRVAMLFMSTLPSLSDELWQAVQYLLTMISKSESDNGLANAAARAVNTTSKLRVEFRRISELAMWETRRLSHGRTQITNYRWPSGNGKLK